MRFFTVFLTLLLTTPVLAHPSHIEAAGGHDHLFELALGGLALLAVAVWFALRPGRTATSDHG